MAAQRQLSELEELTFLRRRVAELERQSSERSRVAGALEQSRDLFDVFLRNMPALAWMKDEMGRYVYANRQFQQFIAQMGASCIGSSDHDLWPADIAERILTADLSAISAREPQDSIEILPSAQGESCFQIRRFPFHTKSGKLYIAGIGIDMGGEQAARAQTMSLLDALRSAEARRDRLFQSELMGVMECSGDAILHANDALLGWLGFSREEARHLNWRTLTPKTWRTRDDAALAELKATGSWKPYEKELLDRAGNPVPVMISARQLETGSEPFLCFALNLRERRQIEERLFRSEKLESLGLIAGAVAHDFNNLLATIMGNASISLDSISRNHSAFEHLNEIVIASRRASELTQQMLAYSGRAAFQIKPTDLSAAVREIGRLLETTISKKIDLNFDLAGNLPYIEADEGQLQQIIMNLVINASDAIGEKPGEITVVTRTAGIGDGQSVCFEVRDTGCGMSEETQSRIFDPFFTTKSNGRGLGLAAVLGIVRNHRGALVVESQPGAGTTFRVVFPASQSRPEPAISPSRVDIRGNETILVVDDDEGIRRMTSAALERLGYRVLSAVNGEEGVEMFREHRGEVAAVLLDWAMPVMNGDEALKRMLMIDPLAKVVMSSGYAETERLKRAESPLLSGFVQKPYTARQLAETLRTAIDGAKTNSAATAES